MTLNILTFGIVKDIVGQTILPIEVREDILVEDLLSQLKQQYPKMHDLTSLLIAVNNEYAQANQQLFAADEIALIPPVSGG